MPINDPDFVTNRPLIWGERILDPKRWSGLRLSRWKRNTAMTVVANCPRGRCPGSSGAAPPNERRHDRASHADVEDANPVPTSRPQELRHTRHDPSGELRLRSAYADSPTL